MKRTLAMKPLSPTVKHDAAGACGTDAALWASADPEAMAEAARDLFGPDAATAAAWCAVSARCDGRKADYRFLLGVFTRLEASPTASPGNELGRSSEYRDRERCQMQKRSGARRRKLEWG